MQFTELFVHLYHWNVLLILIFLRMRGNEGDRMMFEENATERRMKIHHESCWYLCRILYLEELVYVLIVELQLRSRNQRVECWSVKRTYKIFVLLLELVIIFVENTPLLVISLNSSYLVVQHDRLFWYTFCYIFDHLGKSSHIIISVFVVISFS